MGAVLVVETVAFTSPFRRRDVRDLSHRLRDLAGSGERRLVLDLTGAVDADEGSVVLMLLGLRSELVRRSCRLVVAAPKALAASLTITLRLDDVIGAAPSLAEAVEEVQRVAAAP